MQATKNTKEISPNLPWFLSITKGEETVPFKKVGAKVREAWHDSPFSLVTYDSLFLYYFISSKE